ncbi:P-loop containing nucleoside triphosphate hydrolase protein [Entophlyctis helioformis]|nr:P-loop containing nucleoside triphosphate hydrolase protein [Entophlyctis helioformis]
MATRRASILRPRGTVSLERRSSVESQDLSHLMSGSSLVSSISPVTRNNGSSRSRGLSFSYNSGANNGDTASIYTAGGAGRSGGENAGGQSASSEGVRNMAQIVQELGISHSAAFITHQQKLKDMEDHARIEASFCVGVVGSPGSDKRTVIETECAGKTGAHRIVKHHDDGPVIKIITQIYTIGGQNIRVEYWDAPEREDLLLHTARYVAGLAATIFVFDVNDETALEDLIPWIDEIGARSFAHGSMSPFGCAKLLIGNKTDTPGKRVILTAEAEAFAHRYGMKYFETSETDDYESSHEIFQSLVETVFRSAPRDLSPKSTTHTAGGKPAGSGTGNAGASSANPDAVKMQSYMAPIGLHLGMAMDPTTKARYRLKVRETQPARNSGTLVVDWLKSSRPSAYGRRY